MTEAQERFLRAIADRVPPASIAELHLFPAIRQGGYETGIAVIAAEPAAVRTLPATAPEADADAASAAASPEADSRMPVEDDSPYADDALSQGDLDLACEVPESPDTNAPGAFATGEATHRLIVLSARYRLTLKGADRGKWDIEVVAQADAPLVTVDAVVRGVQRRAGDAGDPERLSGEALRALLNDWSCTATTR